MGIKARQTRQRGNGQTGKCRELLIAERRKQQVEPDDIRLALVERLQQARGIGKLIKRPGANYVIVRQLDRCLAVGQLVGENGKTKQWILLQLTRDVETVLIQSPPRRRKRTYQTNFHGPLWHLKERQANHRVEDHLVAASKIREQLLLEPE